MQQAQQALCPRLSCTCCCTAHILLLYNPRSPAVTTPPFLGVISEEEALPLRQHAIEQSMTCVRWTHEQCTLLHYRVYSINEYFIYLIIYSISLFSILFYSISLYSILFALQELEQELEPKEEQIESLNQQLQEQDGELVEELARASVGFTHTLLFTRVTWNPPFHRGCTEPSFHKLQIMHQIPQVTIIPCVL